MMEYDLTVVTVCRNALRTLPSTIDSVVARGRDAIKIEHIVIDGKSTDGTADFLKEQRELGRIARFVSEPDEGIYDAMNKGMAQARGKVLTFLNADDTYAETDLSRCVLPIVRGETSCVAAQCALLREGKRYGTWGGDLNLAYLRIPLPHPSLFIATEVYRSCGGYDAAHFRCAADTDLICRLLRNGMKPRFLHEIVTNFDSSGFSSSDVCERKFLDEHVEIMRRNRDALLRRALLEPEYAELVTVYLISRSAELDGWEGEYGRSCAATAEILGKMCLEHAAAHPAAAAALSWVATRYLPFVASRGRASFLMRQKMDFLRVRTNLSPSSPYVNLGFHFTKKAYLRTRFSL